MKLRLRLGSNFDSACSWCSKWQYVLKFKLYHGEGLQVVVLSSEKRISFHSPDEEDTEELIAYVSPFEASLPEWIALKRSVRVTRGIDCDRLRGKLLRSFMVLAASSVRKPCDFR